MTRTVGVLFARSDSIYKSIEGCDVYDIERDARTWPGGAPVVAHPPCRAWGRLRMFAKPRDDEKALGPWAVGQVRKYGGVLEHPAKSTLWEYCALPLPEAPPDAWGGWTWEIQQRWFDHKCEKKTWLYIVGCRDLPNAEFNFTPPTHCIDRRNRGPDALPRVSHENRERTPPRLAHWLVETARRSVV